MLYDLDISKQGGEDGLTNKMLKLTADSLALPLSRLFNLYLGAGCFPGKWKRGIVVPIFKNKGSKCSPDNYRPVTLLNSVSKLFERLLYDEILLHLQHNNLLYYKQSGFLPGHDTQKQLVDIVHHILENNEFNQLTRGVFLDISGAFDAVPHHLLVKKMHSYGIRGTLLELLVNYLSDRTIRVKVNQCLSESSPAGQINCGVPQGSILGPLLFLIYINDISDVIRNCNLYIYADDCSLFIPVDYEEDGTNSTLLLQSDLDNLSDWSNDWKLHFKADKSKEVIFKPGRRLGPDLPNVHLANNVIPRGASHKHLGVILDQKLSFEEHLTKVIIK